MERSSNIFCPIDHMPIHGNSFIPRNKPIMFIKLTLLLHFLCQIFVLMMLVSEYSTSLVMKLLLFCWLRRATKPNVLALY